MNKLSYKELQSVYVNYLAHDIDVLRPNMINPQKLSGIEEYGLIFNCNGEIQYNHIRDCKLILHPMSFRFVDEALRDEEVSNVVNSDWFHNQFDDIEDMVENYELELWPYSIVKFALKNSYDIFGLIEKRHAIDINTLKNDRR